MRNRRYRLTHQVSIVLFATFTLFPLESSANCNENPICCDAKGTTDAQLAISAWLSYSLPNNDNTTCSGPVGYVSQNEWGYLYAAYNLGLTAAVSIYPNLTDPDAVYTGTSAPGRHYKMGDAAAQIPATGANGGFLVSGGDVQTHTDNLNSVIFGTAASSLFNYLNSNNGGTTSWSSKVVMWPRGSSTPLPTPTPQPFLCNETKVAPFITTPMVTPPPS